MNRHTSQGSGTHSAPGRFIPVLPLRFALIGAAAGAVTGLGVEALTAVLLPAPGLALLTLGRILLATTLTALLGGAVGAGIGHAAQRRLSQIQALTEAWLRGNLALRTDGMHKDEIGQIERSLNLIIEHLEEDEQDLERLRESNTRLTDQVRALAVVEERNRLARELHDSVKQHLFSLAMTASAVRTRISTMARHNIPVPPELDEMVHEMETAAQTAQRETTRLIEDLRPAPLQERGLAAALNDYTLLFGAQQHLLIYLDVRCDDNRLPPLVAETLYRVAQEALHNVARHAHATRVDVALLCAQDRVTLTIDDNGAGFDPQRTHQGLGISGMHERLIEVGGRLQVDSEPGAGTSIRAEVEIAALATTTGASQSQTGGAQAQSARPRTEAWGWLGQKLMIPVGQMWPWPPAEQDLHLRAPHIGPGDYVLRRERRFWGLLQHYVLWSSTHHAALMRLQPEHSGVSWELGAAHWALHRITGRQGRAILERNDQPLAALQHRGHPLDAWTDIIYDDRFYCLTASETPDSSVVGISKFVLTDESNETLMEIEDTDLHLHRALPLPLVLMVAARAVEEGTVRHTTGERERAIVEGQNAGRLSASDKAQQLRLRQELRRVVRDAAGAFPPDIMDRVRALAQSIYTVLPQVKDVGGGGRDAYTIRQTIRDYLPTALADYRSLPAGFAASEPIQDGKTAHEHLLHQLDLLQQAVDEIAERLPREDAQHLLSHGRFLAGKFGKEADPSVTEKDA